MLEAPPVAPGRQPVAFGRLGARGEGLTVVTEQLAELGGVERIAEAVMTRYPAATLLAGRFGTGAGFRAEEFHARLASRTPDEPPRVRWAMQGAQRRHFLAPLYARRLRSASLEGSSVVLSLGAMGWTLAARIPPGARHVGYIGGRPRPYYGYRRQYLSEYPPPARAAVAAALPALRGHHRRMLRRPDRLATNSLHSARELRPLTPQPIGVLYPPVRTDFFTPAADERHHFLLVSRLRAHKRVGPVVEAFRHLGEPLVVAGDGPLRGALELTAPRNVRFVGHLGDGELRELYRTSRGLVSASVEEFGICLVEAQACGTPVVAPRAGGSGEIVRDGETGVALDFLDPGAIAAGVRRMERLGIDPEACRRNAERFSEGRFIAELEDLLED